MKVICKQKTDYGRLIIGKEYKVIKKYDSHEDHYFFIALENCHLWLPKNCFYSIKELRKQKIQNLNENR